MVKFGGTVRYALDKAQMFHIAYIESDRHRQFTFEQIATRLHEHGFDNELHIYHSPEAALDQLPLERPDIVFVDVCARTERKPSGLDLVRALRQHPLCKQTVIIGMAEHALPADCNAALAAGCNEFVPKPTRCLVIEDVIQRWLRQPQG
jgi:two-component system cell cycle response regulator DivK